MTHSTVIILVNWNGLAYTKACLESLSDEPADIIVVDNGSKDGSAEALRMLFPQVHIIESETNLGFTGGNNLAISYVLERNSYDYVLLLNNDTEAYPGLVMNLENAIRANIGLGAIQPLILQFEDRSLVWNAGTKYNKWTNKTSTIGFDEKSTTYQNCSCYVPWLTGCAFMVKVEALRRVGLLDDRFFAYYEDVDLSFRLREVGYDLFLSSDSVVYHHAGASSKSKEKSAEGFLSPKVHYLNIRNRFFLLRKHITGVPMISSFFAMMVDYSIYLIYFLLRGRLKKFNAVLKGINDGITTKL